VSYVHRERRRVQAGHSPSPRPVLRGGEPTQRRLACLKLAPEVLQFTCLTVSFLLITPLDECRYKAFKEPYLSTYLLTPSYQLVTATTGSHHLSKGAGYGTLAFGELIWGLANPPPITDGEPTILLAHGAKASTGIGPLTLKYSVVGAATDGG